MVGQFFKNVEVAMSPMYKKQGSKSNPTTLSISRHCIGRMASPETEKKTRFAIFFTNFLQWAWPIRISNIYFDSQILRFIPDVNAGSQFYFLRMTAILCVKNLFDNIHLKEINDLTSMMSLRTHPSSSFVQSAS